MLGYDSTLPVTMDDMIRHSQAVRRGSPNSWLLGDMPYMSYQASVESAIRNAGRFMAEASCDAVKLEGGAEMADQMAGIVRAGIPAMGHLGLTPQSVSALGGFRLQGKGALQAKKIVDDAKALEQAGAFAVLLELVPDRVCKLITERAESCIIISLGSGPDAHGQLLIYHDMFGLYPKFKPRMAKVYGDAGQVITSGILQYVKEVTDHTFPAKENYFGMKDEEYDELLQLLD
jgi:3-methyl-2-oxobutanoate hydroxymethyltransferase